MPDKNSGRPVPRPKTRLAPRPIPRAKHVLPSPIVAEAAGERPGRDRTSASGFTGRAVQVAQSSGEPRSPQSDNRSELGEVRDPRIEKFIRLPGRSKTHLDAEGFALNSRQNDLRFEELPQGRKDLRSARDWLKELRDNAPRPNVLSSRSIALAELVNALRSAQSWLKGQRKNTAPSNRPSSRTRLKTSKIDGALAAISGSFEVIGNMKNQQDQDAHARLVANQEQIVSGLEKQVEALEKEDREIEAQKGDLTRERKSLPPEN